MKIISAILLLVIIAIAIPGCGGGSVTTMDSRHTRVFVIATAIGPDGAPLADAEIQLPNPDSSGGTPRTGADGRFTANVIIEKGDTNFSFLIVKDSQGVNNLVVVENVPGTAATTNITFTTNTEGRAATIDSVAFSDSSGNPVTSDDGSDTPAPTNTPTSGGGSGSTPAPTAPSTSVPTPSATPIVAPSLAPVSPTPRPAATP